MLQFIATSCLYRHTRCLRTNEMTARIRVGGPFAGPANLSARPISARPPVIRLVFTFLHRGSHPEHDCRAWFQLPDAEMKIFDHLAIGARTKVDVRAGANPKHTQVCTTVVRESTGRAVNGPSRGPAEPRTGRATGELDRTNKRSPRVGNTKTKPAAMPVLSSKIPGLPIYIYAAYTQGFKTVCCSRRVDGLVHRL